MWSGKLPWKDTAENTAGRLSPLVPGETAEQCHRKGKDGSKNVSARPLPKDLYQRATINLFSAKEPSGIMCRERT